MKTFRNLATIEVKIPRYNIVCVNYESIDWNKKNVIENSDYEELELISDLSYKIFDIRDQKVNYIKPTYIDTDYHRLMVKDTLYVILHKYKV